jgi:molecular chaperone DnaK
MSTSRGILDEAVGIETLGGTFTPLISQGVELPTSFADNFSTGADNQNAVQLTFQAGTSTNDARVLGMFIINQIAPAPRGIPRIRVTVSVETNGEVRVAESNSQTGLTKSASLGRVRTRKL